MQGLGSMPTAGAQGPRHRSHTHTDFTAGFMDIFCKGPGSKQVMLSGPHGLCRSRSPLLPQHTGEISTHELASIPLKLYL